MTRQCLALVMLFIPLALSGAAAQGSEEAGDRGDGKCDAGAWVDDLYRTTSSC